MFVKHEFEVIYQTRKTVFDHIYDALRRQYFLANVEVFVANVIHGLECFIYLLNHKIVKIFVNYQDQISKHCHSHNFLCLKLMKYQ